MGHVQDPPVSTNMISIVCMIYHMKVHMFGYNLGPPKMSKSKIHILTISEPISMKPALVEQVITVESIYCETDGKRRVKYTVLGPKWPSFISSWTN